VVVIDEDLGKSGASAEQRSGFQRLLAEIGLARVGLVTSLDASRLARNNRDWYQLLELCAMFGALIADSEQLYDPRLYHDRLLLGLSGMMSEAELHHIKLRLQAGEWHKAERGELRVPLPVGLVRQRDGAVTLDPDEEIQGRLRLLFEKFATFGSAYQVLRYLHQAELPLPARPTLGPAPHEIVWHPATASRIFAILHNPAYAGAYVYGRKKIDPTRRKAGRPGSGSVRRPLNEWPVCLQGIYPAYISWDQFLANQERLRDNQNRYEHALHGVPRKGRALLQGLVVCGRCGARLRLRYSGPQGEYPVYECTYDYQHRAQPRCQEVRAIGFDAEIEQLVLAALAPDRVALALEAFAQAEREAKDLQSQWRLRRERAKYETERAARQYQQVEPENRLVARNLERQWEEKLRASDDIEHAYQRWLASHKIILSESDRREILRLGEDLPQVWHAPTTTNVEHRSSRPQYPLMHGAIASLSSQKTKRNWTLWRA